MLSTKWRQKMSSEVEKAIAWLLNESEKIDFGEVCIKVVKHNGEIKFIEKQATEKIQIKGATK